MNPLEGRVAIVTGANHGIGAAIANALAGSGAAVVATYLRLDDEPTQGIPAAYRSARSKDAGDVIDAIESAGGAAISIEADLADPATPSTLFDAAEARFGPVGILINNASGWIADTFQPGGTDRLGRAHRHLDPASLGQVFDVDAGGSALMIAEFAQRHHASGADWGRIIGLTSGGDLGFPGEVSYGAAKAALENLHMSAGLELADRGITANVVHPPVTDTGWVTDEVRDAVAENPTLFSIATPQDVAGVVLWLCTNQAALVNANKIYMR